MKEHENEKNNVQVFFVIWEKEKEKEDTVLSFHWLFWPRKQEDRQTDKDDEEKKKRRN